MPLLPLANEISLGGRLATRTAKQQPEAVCIPAPIAEPVKGDPSNELEWFQWVGRICGRIVWGEYSSGKPFCRVRAGRWIECEDSTFLLAAQQLYAKLRQKGDPMANFMRLEA